MPELLADHREDEIRLGLGQIPLHESASEPAPPPAAADDRAQRLHRLIPLAQRVLLDVEENHQAFHAMRSAHEQPAEHGHRRQHHQRQMPQLAPRRSAASPPSTAPSNAAVPKSSIPTAAVQTPMTIIIGTNPRQNRRTSMRRVIQTARNIGSEILSSSEG